MKRIAGFMLSFIILLCSLPVSAAVEPVPEVQAQNILMINTNTGATVYEKNADEKIYPASTTKIMTMILVLENCKNQDDIVTVSEHFDDDLMIGSSGITLKVGERMTVRDLLYATAVASANDAANALAEYISGSTTEFVKLMNQKAEQLGAKHTHFNNTHGLPDENHYTTARDMMLIMRYALKNEQFRTLCSTYAYTIPATEYTEKRTISTTNSLISSVSENYYRYAVGGKTGTTTAAGYNLISWASKGDIDFVLVAMHAEKKPGSTNPIFRDSKKLYNWAFDNYAYQQVADANQAFQETKVTLSAEKDYVMLSAKESLSAILPKDTALDTLEYVTECPDELQAPVVKGEVYGKLTVQKDGIVYATTDLIAAENVSRSAVLYYLHCIKQFFKNIVVQIVTAVLVILLIVYIVLMVRKNRRRKRMHYRGSIRF